MFGRKHQPEPERKHDSDNTPEVELTMLDVSDWLYEHVCRRNAGRIFVTQYEIGASQFAWVEGRDLSPMSEIAFEAIRTGFVIAVWYEHWITGEPVLVALFSEELMGGWELERTLFPSLLRQWNTYAYDTGLCDPDHGGLRIVWRRTLPDNAEERSAIAQARLLAQEAREELDKTRKLQQKVRNGNKRNNSRRRNQGNAPEPPPWWNDNH